MKKLFSLLFILFISFSFGQIKNKKNTSNSPSTSKSETISCGCTNNEDNNDENKIHFGDTDTRPELLGNLTKEQLIKDNFKTPIVNGKKIFGKIYVTFVIEKDGNISNINILRDVGHGTGEEAIRILQNMPRWNPAKKDGKIVRSLYPMPITIP